MLQSQTVPPHSPQYSSPSISSSQHCQRNNVFELPWLLSLLDSVSKLAKANRKAWVAPRAFRRSPPLPRAPPLPLHTKGEDGGKSPGKERRGLRARLSERGLMEGSLTSSSFALQPTYIPPVLQLRQQGNQTARLFASGRPPWGGAFKRYI